MFLVSRVKPSKVSEHVHGDIDALFDGCATPHPFTDFIASLKVAQKKIEPENGTDNYADRYSPMAVARNSKHRKYNERSRGSITQEATEQKH